MKTRKIALALLSVLILSGLLMVPASAATFPSLPPGQVTMALTDDGENNWPGTATLSGVPDGYDVQNGPYTAWCSEFLQHISYAPVSYQVSLVSSIGLGAPWDKVNYLLNHNTGEDMDLQAAIWLLFGVSSVAITADFPTQPSADALAIYDDANAHGAGFIPSATQVIAVKCVTEGNTEEGSVQDLIIQLTSERFEGLTPGYWKNHLSKWNGFLPTAKLDTVFTNDGTGVHLNSFTLQQALSFGGGPGIAGAEQILLRAAVAALLNSASLTIDYPLTTTQVITQVHSALATNNRGTILTLAAELDSYNNLGGS